MKREDFTYEIYQKGPYGGYVCDILYENEWVAGFGICPDGTNRKRKGRDNSWIENAEVTIRQIMAGLSPAISARIEQIQTAKAVIKQRVADNKTLCWDDLTEEEQAQAHGSFLSIMGDVAADGDDEDKYYLNRLQEDEDFCMDMLKSKDFIVDHSGYVFVNI